MKKVIEIVLIGLVVLVLYAAICAVVAFVFELGWNVVAPTFHWPQIGFWTSYCIIVLLSIIGGAFKSSSSK